MRPVPAGRQRGQCCTPYSRLQEEIDNVETIAVTANNTANNAANAANTAVNTANSALAGLDDKVDKLSTVGRYAYTHNGSTQGETALENGTTADTIPIKDSNGRMQAANPASGATDNTLITANWISQTGNTAPNNVVHRTANEDIDGIKTFKNIIYRQCTGSGQSTLRINNSSGNHYLSSLYDSNNKLRHQINTQAVITGDLATRTVFAMQTPDYDTVAQTGYRAELTLELVGSSGVFKLVMYKRAGDGTLTSTTLGTL